MHLIMILVFFVCNVIAIPAGTSAVVGAVEATPAVTPSPSVSIAQLAAISGSISSLLNRLEPPSSITSELTAFPTSVLSALEGLNVLSAFDQLYADKGAAWFESLSSGAESWVLGLPVQAATILPQVISLQSLANNAAFPAPTQISPPNNVSPTAISTNVTAVATVASTSTAPVNRGMTQGKQIGAIIGSAAVAALVLTLGVMICDARKRRGIARSYRAYTANNNATRPPIISLANLRSRRHRTASDDTAVAALRTAEPGLVNAVQKGSANHRVDHKQEIHELHSPGIGY